MALKYILPALAVAGSAAAASCSVSATTTIQSSGDATSLASCQTFTGSIAIATGTTDSIDLSGIEEITGDLYADSVKSMAEISSTTLETIGGTMHLYNLTVLSTLNFPVLTNVENVDWNGLPALQGLSFTDGVQMAQNLSIQNTFLGTLDGINLETVGTVNIANNYYLATVSMQLANVSNSLTIAANGKDVTAEFPNLIWANSMTINNVSVFSAPSLAAINTSIYFNSDYVTSIYGPNLTTVGNALSILDCSSLTNASFPKLKSIGSDLKIGDNDALKTIDGFPLLSTIGGALDFHGNFTSASLPDITFIKGAFSMVSESDISSTCSHFSSLAGSNNVIQGSYTCTSGSSTSSSTTSTSSGSSTTTTNAANGMYVPAASGFLGVVAVIFGML